MNGTFYTMAHADIPLGVMYPHIERVLGDRWAFEELVDTVSAIPSHRDAWQRPAGLRDCLFQCLQKCVYLGMLRDLRKMGLRPFARIRRRLTLTTYPGWS